MTDNTKIKIRLGAFEFEAEGPAETVKEQYSKFLESVATYQTAKTQTDGLNASPPPVTAPPATPQSPAPPTEATNPTATPAVDDLMSRVFKESDGLVSLKAMPQGAQRNADALLLLLYGYHRLLQKDDVLGAQLMKAALKSGINDIDRVEYGLGPYYRQYIISGGFRRSRTYGLNNQGIAKAEEILKAVIQ